MSWEALIDAATMLGLIGLREPNAPELALLPAIQEEIRRRSVEIAAHPELYQLLGGEPER